MSAIETLAAAPLSGYAVARSADFEHVERSHGSCWKHKMKACWIVFYESLQDAGKPCFIAYTAIEGSFGCDPWTVNNRRDGAFRSLEDAMGFASSVSC